MTTYTPDEDITLSAQEDRMVSLYPDTESEYEAMCVALLAECDGNEERSGSGYSGREEAGSAVYWGKTEAGNEWQVEVVRVPS